MKGIGIFLISIVLISCYHDDDYSLYSSNFAIENAVTIENNKEYVVGDTIYFELKFSRYIKEEGYTELLDVYETTGDEEFVYEFDFYELTDTFEGYSRSINIDPKYIITEEINLDYYSYGNMVSAKLNESQDAYESRVGVVLIEEGSFSFSFDHLILHNGYAYDNDKIYLNIHHSFSTNFEFDAEFVVIGE